MEENNQLGKSLNGFKQGRLTVIDDNVIKYDSGSRRIHFLCKCSCGNRQTVYKSNFVTRKQQSCGCLRDELTSERMKTHGLSKDTKFMDAFYSPRKRVRRGGTYEDIKCNLGTMQDFIDNMYDSFLVHCKEHGRNNTSLDRINNFGHYEYGNLRWATSKVQNNNQRRRKDQKRFIINYEGDKYTFHNKAECSRQLNIHTSTLGAWLSGKSNVHHEKVLYIKYTDLND